MAAPSLEGPPPPQGTPFPVSCHPAALQARQAVTCGCPGDLGCPIPLPMLFPELPSPCLLANSYSSLKVQVGGHLLGGTKTISKYRSLSPYETGSRPNKPILS